MSYLSTLDCCSNCFLLVINLKHDHTSTKIILCFFLNFFNLFISSLFFVCNFFLHLCICNLIICNVCMLLFIEFLDMLNGEDVIVCLICDLSKLCLCKYITCKKKIFLPNLVFYGTFHCA